MKGSFTAPDAVKGSFTPPPSGRQPQRDQGPLGRSGVGLLGSVRSARDVVYEMAEDLAGALARLSSVT